MKHLKTIIPSIVLTILFCYICMTPGTNYPEPTINRTKKNGDTYYTLTYEGEKYVTKLIEDSVWSRQEWLNVKTKKIIPTHRWIFIVDSGNLYDVVNDVHEKERIENLIEIVGDK